MNPASMDFRGRRISANAEPPANGSSRRGIRRNSRAALGVVFNPAAAESLFVGMGHTVRGNCGLARIATRCLILAGEVIEGRCKSAVKEGGIGKSGGASCRGSDPALKTILSCFPRTSITSGLRPPINVDRIYNGAMDDGSGSALEMDIAASLKAHPEKLGQLVDFPAGDRGRKRPAGLEIFRRAPDGAGKIDRCRRQRGHVPADQCP